MTKSASNASALGGIHDLFRRLDDIEVKCLGKSEGKEDSLDSKDKFLALKATMNHDLSDMKALIYERMVCDYDFCVFIDCVGHIEDVRFESRGYSFNVADSCVGIEIEGGLDSIEGDLQEAV